MNILVTGAKGFVGKNLVCALKNIRDKKDNSHSEINIDDIFEYDTDSNAQDLEFYCQKADFVFNLAGVNRPKETIEFMKGNFGFANTLLDRLKDHKNTCPIMLASSIQAALVGRYANSSYGKSKLEGEKLFFDYSKNTSAEVLIYRFPNLFGKWCRPNYNSVIATFCNNIANELPIHISDPSIELELVYIDDVIEEMINALSGNEHRCDYETSDIVANTSGRYCYVPLSYRVSLGEITELLYMFKQVPDTLIIPEIPNMSFVKKLYSTYLSYLPREKIKFSLKTNYDNRGSFTELLKTKSCGQFSVNVSKPGITKGQHWHQSKWELFIVISGHGLIQERKIGLDENNKPFPILNFEVSGNKLEAIHMLPGYTHSIINLSETENLVTLMWANEHFDICHPDTFYEQV